MGEARAESAYAANKGCGGWGGPNDSQAKATYSYYVANEKAGVTRRPEPRKDGFPHASIKGREEWKHSVLPNGII